MKQMRQKFEAAKWVQHPQDGALWNPNAEPKCKTCKGFGIVDAGGNISECYENCPDCWRGGGE